MNTPFQAARIEQRPFGQANGRDTTLWTLCNRHGMRVSVCNFGAIITSIQVPARNGLTECVLGFESAEDYTAAAYRAHYPYLGAVIGRHAGRIAHARAPLNGRLLQLEANHHGHQLHGGPVGFDSVLWQYHSSRSDDNGSELTLSHTSANGDQGYPGTLHTRVTYHLGNDNALRVQFEAECEQDTLVNLTQHSYFHLGGADDGTVARHQLRIAADSILNTDAALMTDGTLLPLDGHALDFRQARAIADTAIDTAFVLPEGHGPADPAATLHHPDSGIRLDVCTDNPVLVVYNGVSLPTLPAPGRRALQPFGAICFEAQGYTDAANHPAFPPNILRAGEVYRRHTVYAFAW
ncbi:aldose 1-epimerase [Neisseria sp. HSC-16F19]|nr:aldose epimerase family protein [Neisseria sp. HSC-16F19]MCP2039635.1 aldose 1-epimerase [Neisseria sp. HSC-16F19]